MSSADSPFDPRPRAFISYSRADGESFASGLRERLQREEPALVLWQDRTQMEGGVGWWKQISEAIEKIEILIMVMTPGAFTSEVARKEWRYARQQGVRVCPVMGVPAATLAFAELPVWMKKVHFYDLTREWSTFVAFLKTARKVERIPFMAPDLRGDFVQRPDQFDMLMARLLDRTRTNPVAITTALKGPGGFGKTTLAVAVCHDENVVAAFDDGILWTTLGENPNLQHEVAKVYAALTGERPPFIDVEDASIQLATRLEEKQCLFVIDDVWDPDHAKPFLRGGKNCARLITTRLFPVVTELDASHIFVDEMTTDQAVQMLTSGLDPSVAERVELQALARRLGEWPLLLRLAGSQIRERMGRGDSLAGALAYVNSALERRGAVAFDRANPKQRHDAVAKTVATSLESLSEDQRTRCAELAIFPEDRPIPLSAVRALWKTDVYGTEELVQRLDDVGLLELDIKTASFRMHDVLRWHLESQLRDVRAVHARLIHEGWVDLRKLPDAYAWRWIGWHLTRAGEGEVLQGLLLDLDWLQAKLNASDVESLLRDFDSQRQRPEVRLLGDCLRLGAHGLIRDPFQLGAQLVGRLERGLWQELDRLLDAVRGRERPLELTFVRPSLTRPGGAMIGILKGHTQSVEAVALSADGRLAISASLDRTLRVWDLDSGRAVRALDGHEGPVLSVALADDCQSAASGSEDRTVRIWDLQRGEVRTVLRGHYGAVTGVAFSADGGTVGTVADDRTARLWDLRSGTQRLVFTSNSHQLRALAFPRSGASLLLGDGEWRILQVDLQSGRVRRTFTGHKGIVRALAVTADGRMLSGAQDGTVRLWNLDTGALICTLQGHTDSVDGVAVAQDGRHAVSASADRTLRTWDLHDGRLLQVLEGHSGGIRGVAINRQGDRAISGSGDRSVRLWNQTPPSATEGTIAGVGTATGEAEAASFVAITAGGDEAISVTRGGRVRVWTLEAGGAASRDSGDVGHHELVTCIRSPAQGGLLVTGSRDRTVRLWDTAANRVRHVMVGHTRALLAIEITAEADRIVSLARDRTMRVWDTPSGRVVRALVGSDHDPSSLLGGRDSALLQEVAAAPIVDVAPIPLAADGMISLAPRRPLVAFGSYSRLIAWEIDTGQVHHVNIGDFDVQALAVEPAGRWLVAGSRFGDLMRWDFGVTGTRLLEGHRGSILDLMITPDGRSVISAATDDTIRCWDLASGATQRLVQGTTGVVDAVAISPNADLAYAVYGDTVVAFDLVKWIRASSLSLDHRITSMAVAPDGHVLVVGDEAGRVHFLCTRLATDRGT